MSPEATMILSGLHEGVRDISPRPSRPARAPGGRSPQAMAHRPALGPRRAPERQSVARAS